VSQWRKALKSTRQSVTVAVAGVMVAVLWLGTNWRLAVLAAAVAGAIGMTRLRYAPQAAVALLAVTVLFAQTGHTAGHDDRDPPGRTSGR
jgi:fatty acid desaturase